MIDNVKKKLRYLFKFRPCDAEANGAFAIPSRPNVVHLAISRTCNINCIMCPIDRDKLKGKKKFLDFATFKRVFDDGGNFVN